jgi:site-specific DNA-adenine methylase
VTLAIPSAEEVAQTIGTPGDLDGVVVYMDPPYVGTSGYLHDLPRSEVIRIARSYDALGAVVCISEAEVIGALGWHSTEIFKTGNARTFSKQKREFLTVNRSIKTAWSVSPMFSASARVGV